MDTDIQQQALKWAEGIIEQFVLSKNPAHPLQGESLDMYRDLDSWGWFTHTQPESEVTKLFLATRKYAKIKWAKDHPPKNKPTPWQLVTGKAKRR